MPTLADRIRVAREDAGLSQAELSRAIGISTAAMSQIATGQTRTLKASTVNAISRATGYRAEWLESGRGPVKVPAAADEQIDFILRGLEQLPPDHRKLIEDQIRALVGAQNPQ